MMNPELESEERRKKTRYIGRHLAITFLWLSLIHIYLTMDVRYKEHVALLGRNGCGKTTLLRMVLGEIPADEGILKLGGSVTVGYLPQQVHFPKEDVSVLEAFRDGLVIGEGKAREELARYLFTGENVFKKVDVYKRQERGLCG